MPGKLITITTGRDCPSFSLPPWELETDTLKKNGHKADRMNTKDFFIFRSSLFYCEISMHQAEKSVSECVSFTTKYLKINEVL